MRRITAVRSSIAVLDKPYPYQDHWSQPLRQTGKDLVEGDYKAEFQTDDGSMFYYSAYASGYGSESIDINTHFVDAVRRTDITGQGDAFRIFATIAHLTLKTLDTVRQRFPDYPTSISFGGDDASRLKLYNRLAQGVAKARGGKVSDDTSPGNFIINFPPLGS